MDAIRLELEEKKRPKAQQDAGKISEVEQQKQQHTEHMEKVKQTLNVAEDELAEKLEQCNVEVKHKVFTHVTIQFGEERVTTRRVHGATVFSFNQYEIKRQSKLKEKDIAGEE